LDFHLASDTICIRKYHWCLGVLNAVFQTSHCLIMSSWYFGNEIWEEH